MAKISKVIGSVVGAAIGFAAAKLGLPAEFNTPEVITAVTALISAAAVYFFPANG